ncbi:ATP-dependent dethiobiotin synthetase BioD [Agarivorans sp. Toyoura001]|uniref:dethiobiotin synthase n=1 Tax=Agarivorans sp. Toyoura001 TaxID=2283141 RepID=UPI0010EC89B1|nr:dethiobiotin synthase [Agarivorans sp. Toyoura001]GDY27423.1 ATP-dependent dethiobiotin synthetase BioD [Agarivorans sp. Toyoura001]
MTKAIFVTGTDTEVGKTVVSCGLIKALQKHSSGLVVNGFKPIAAGAEQSEQGLVNEDGLAIQAVSSSSLSYQTFNPVVLEQAIAPHIAARFAKKPIDTHLMDSGLNELKALSDCVVVEGAGGWHVPLNDNAGTMSQWVANQQLPVLLVVGVKLGCLNHALLSVQAIKASGVRLIGWVANVLNDDEQISTLNIEYLQGAIEAPCVATIPYKTDLKPQSIEKYFNINKLIGEM